MLGPPDAAQFEIPPGFTETPNGSERSRQGATPAVCYHSRSLDEGWASRNGIP